MNRSLLTSVMCTILLVICTDSFAQKYQDGLIDKTVALIGNDMVMLSELESEVQMLRARGLTADKSARCEILEGLLVSKLFLVQARLDSLTVNENGVENALDNRMNEMYSALVERSRLRSISASRYIN